MDVDFLSIPCLLRGLQAKDASFNICKFKIIGSNTQLPPFPLGSAGAHINISVNLLISQYKHNRSY